MNATYQSNATNCSEFRPQSEFPSDLFSLEQRRHGAIIIHFLAAVYVVVIAEHICDEYFMPSLEYLSFEKLKLKPHVAGIYLFVLLIINLI